MPTLPRRWLLTLERLPLPVYLSDVPGDVNGRFYEPGLATVQVPATSIDFDTMSIAAPSAVLALDPGISRLFDPAIYLSRAEATLSYWTGEREIGVAKGKVRDVKIGTAGELHTFRIEETWKKNPDFPPGVVDKTRFPKKQIRPEAEGRALPQAFGDAYCQPCFPVRSLPSSEQTLVLIAGHTLGSKIAPVSFPWPTYPSTAGKVRNSLVGLHYGQNPMLRDGFESAADLRGWDVDAGSWTQAGGFLDTTAATARRIWDAWTYSRQVSVQFTVQALDANAGRRVDFFWGWENSNNYSRASVRFDTGEVVTEIVEGGASAMLQTHADAATITAPSVVRIDIHTGTLAVTVNDREFSFGRIAGSVGGQIGIGSILGAFRFSNFQMPSMARRGVTAANMNAAIVRRVDNKGSSYVAERYRNEPGEQLYATFHEAQNVRNAGELVDRLVRSFSGYAEEDLDELSLERMSDRLGAFRVGAYFNEQSPLFDTIQGRLAPQFFFFLTPEGGRLRGFALDPSQEIEREFRLGVELIEQHGPAQELEKFTRFRARYRFFAPLAGREGRQWEGRAALDPTNDRRMKDLESRYGRNDYGVVDLPDVVTDVAAEKCLTYLAALHANPTLISYVMEAKDFSDLRWGMMVGLTDVNHEYTARAALFVGRQFLTRDLVVNTFRTVQTAEDEVVTAAIWPLVISEGWNMVLPVNDTLVISEGWNS